MKNLKKYVTGITFAFQAILIRNESEFVTNIAYFVEKISKFDIF